VEGLAAWRKGLLVGFRSPLHEERAVLAHVANPVAATNGEKAEIAAIHELDLGGRGVRDLATVGAGLLVLAGNAGPGGDFQLFHWCGRDDAPATPVLLPPLPEGFQPEALALTRDGGRFALHLFSDDGDSGCKERPPMARRFRVLPIPVAD
jgi:hypothetical protein